MNSGYDFAQDPTTFSEPIRNFIKQLDLKKAHFKGSREEELWCLCPFHDDKHPKNFSINLISGKFKCFSCLAGGNILVLLSEKGFTYDFGLSLWHTVKKDEIENVHIPEPPADKWIVENYKKKGHCVKSLERCNWDTDLLELYGIYSDDQENPVYMVQDYHSKVRSIMVKYGKEDIPLYNGGYKEDGYFFGQHLPRTDHIVLVEGIWDAIHVYKISGLTAWAMCGLNLSPMRIKTLEQSGCKFILMVDGDKSGRLFRDKVHDMEIKCQIYFTGKYNCDPDELSEEQLLQILNKKQSWLDYYFTRNKK